MLSVEIPPSGPPCSSPCCNNSVSNGGDESHHRTHFSIRDYVFVTRSKDIEANWPFPEQFLHLCLKHGVKSILPPFEPPNAVRAAQCQRKAAENQPITHLDGDKAVSKVDSLGSEKSELKKIKYDACTPSDLDQSPLSEKDNLTANRANEKPVGLSRSSDSSKVCGGGDFALETSLEAVNPLHSSKKTNTSCETLNQKRRLIVRLGPISRFIHTEEPPSNSSALLEPMASKVCPVCKTFSSTSNTTLNAHIDQCLAMESTITTTRLTERKVKPQKKRLLVDIYATAPSCTLEELDQRNGSNWATGLNLKEASDESCSERKRRQKDHANFMNDGDEIPVYVDSNGMKLGILSKFDNASTPMALESCKPRKHAKEDGKKHTKENCKKHMKENGRNSREFADGNIKCHALKCSKGLSQKSHGRKSSSLKLNKGEIHGMLHGKKHLEYNQMGKGELLSELLKTQSPTKGCDAGSLQQWVCSKRTNLMKKLTVRDPLPRMEDPVIKSNQPAPCNSSTEESLVLKLSRLPEHSSSPSKSAEILSNMITKYGDKSSKLLKCVFNKSMEETSSESGGCLSKIGKSCESHGLSPRRKIEEMKTISIQQSPEMSEGPHAFSQNARKISTWMKSAFSRRPSVPMEASECNDNRKLLPFKKFLKVKKNRKQDWSKHVTRSGRKKILNNLFVERTEKPRGIGSKASDTSGKNTDPKEPHVRTDCPDHTMEIADSHKKSGDGGLQFKYNVQESLAKDSMAHASINYPAGKTTGGLDTRINVTQSSGDILPPVHSHVQANSSPSLDESVQDTFMSCADQEFHFSEHFLIQGSAATTTCPREMVPGLLQENESIKKKGPQCDQDQHEPIGGVPSGSPVCAASNVLNPVAEVSEFKHLNQESTLASATCQESSNSIHEESGIKSPVVDPHDVERVLGAEGIKLRTEKLEIMESLGKESVRLCGDQAFKCNQDNPSMSCQGSQLLREKSKMNSTMILPDERKQQLSRPMEFHTSGRVPNFKSEDDTISVESSSFATVENPISPASPSSQTHHCPTFAHPILRLMGKNVIVGSNNEDDSVRPQVALDDHQIAPITTFHRCPASDVSKFHCYNHLLSNDSVAVSLASHSPQMDSDACCLARFKSGAKLEVLKEPLQLSGDYLAMCPSGFAGSTLQTQQKKMNEPTSLLAHNAEIMAPQKHISSIQAASSEKEVIVIDDSSDSDSDPCLSDANCVMGSRMNHLQRMGISTPANLSHSMKEPAKGFHMSCPGENASYVKRVGGSEDSGVLPERPFVIQSLSTGYVN